ncbi:adenylyltransferase and sulfurtransferase MOCS3 [Cimex lectularius]|uniref:Adenylyltransferase and sulfurtransferase MOCS3 homolog n=1 Tax=Cimex lectularius TaxID=79782 RepID=A0A8I6SQR0_CIMLE|nr:adenylyltransferase and sulfurtransferase MOCS3 [Cimex lectularius]
MDMPNENQKENHQGSKYQPEHSLSNRELMKYSRQMIVPSIGVQGQEKFKKASVLIVGCGGLGCPAAQYLVGTGIGRIGLLDYDDVEESNLHRQILHKESSIGISKVESVASSLMNLNSEVKIEKHHKQICSSNASEIVSKYDIVIDATDNVPTRYLLNDVCVLLNRPLVSGSAIKMEGQLTVYNCKGGPCYRCLFPQPPPPEAVSNCGDVGVLGPVPGVIGVLQALQAVNIILENEGVLSGKLLIFDGLETTFRTVKLRNRSEKCLICSDHPTIKQLVDYEQFCGSRANDKNPNLKILSPSQRVSAKQLHEVMLSGKQHVVVDVRSPIEFQMCHIAGSVNLPLDDISKRDKVEEAVPKAEGPEKTSVYVVCRRGNDSQIGTKKLMEMLKDVDVYDLKGGLHAWASDVDTNFPVY